MGFIEDLLTRRHSFILPESKWELLAVCRAGLFSLRLCRPASPPPTLTAAASSDLTVQQLSMLEQPTVTMTSGNDNREKIDFQQTIIDFQEKTILTSLKVTVTSRRNSAGILHGCLRQDGEPSHTARNTPMYLRGENVTVIEPHCLVTIHQYVHNIGLTAGHWSNRSDTDPWT